MSDNIKNYNVSRGNAARNKRANRIKKAILSVAVILLFASVVLNIILAIKVFRLETKIDKLYSQTLISKDVWDI